MVTAVHIKAPARCWSSRTDTLTCRGADRYIGWPMRSKNTATPDRTSHGSVARNRYKTIDQGRSVDDDGHGWITGHQNNSPPARNDACSIACHPLECTLSVSRAGTCQATSAVVAATQHTKG